VNAIPTEDEVGPESLAREICLRMLTLAPRSRAQLARALQRARIPDDTAEAVLGRFAEVGLIDDAEFAAAWVESRHPGKGLARDALAHELGERGVAEDVRLAAVDRIDADAELATARRLVARRLAATRHLSAVARARKLCAMLARKGYPEEIVLRVVREALRDEGVDLALVEGIVDF
jgi:regulatory protein